MINTRQIVLVNPRSVKDFAKIIILFVCFSSPLIFSQVSRNSVSNYNSQQHQQSIISLSGNWQYKWGNSPVDSNGNYTWLYEAFSDTSWKSIDKPSDISFNPNQTDLWVRTKLPQWNGHGAAILIERIEQIMEIFLDGKEIYTYGNFSAKEKIATKGWHWHLIKLPPDFGGKIISFHFRSNDPYIGIVGPVKLGSAISFIGNIIKSDLAKIIISVILISLGILSFIVLIFLKQLKYYLGLVIFQISLGIWTIATSALTQIFINAPRFFFYADHIALYTAVTGFFIFAGEIIEPKYKIIMRRIWQINLLYLIAVIIIDYITFPEYIDTVEPYLIILAVSSLVSLGLIILSALNGNYETRLLLVAMTVYAAVALAEIYNYFENVVWHKGTFQIHYVDYGGFLFYLLLCLVIFLRYLKMNKQNISAKEEILKNQQIALEAVRNEKIIQEEFAHHLISSQENERKWIAMELHDSIGQDLLIIKNNLLAGIQEENNPQKLSRYIQSASNITSQALQDVRAIAQNLRPQFLDELGLTASLESVTEKIAASSEIEFEVSIEQIDSLIPAGQEINFFRIVQESLNNIIKHSGATNASVIVKKNDDRIELLIEDNGKGINENYNRGGLGLTGMKERAFMLGGKLEVTPRAGSGTKVYLEIPGITGK